MTTDDQLQFLFADGHSPQLGTPLYDNPLVSEIAQICGSPIGRQRKAVSV
jgi:prepilin-type processing-associated H-X9-DG protein